MMHDRIDRTFENFACSDESITAVLAHGFHDVYDGRSSGCEENLVARRFGFIPAVNCLKAGTIKNGGFSVEWTESCVGQEALFAQPCRSNYVHDFVVTPSACVEFVRLVVAHCFVEVGGAAERLFHGLDRYLGTGVE